MIWIGIAYLTVSIAVFLRYWSIAVKHFNVYKDQEIEINKGFFSKTAALDALKWPWYIIWFGLKQWTEDLK
jgi:hypothetical protein